MKFRRSRHFRRQVKYYQIQYGYHEPANVLLDGNFIKVAVEKQMDIAFQFTKYSKLKSTLKITQCVLNELNQLRSHFPGVFSAASKLPLVRCGHFQGVGAHECLLDLVKLAPRNDSSNQFYWIMTQDETLREKLVELEHVPIVYLATHNMLILMEPSHHLERKMQQLDKFMPQEHEYKLIGPLKKEEKKKLLQNKLAKLRKERNSLQLKPKKPAKGQNPLSRIRRQVKPMTKTIRKRRHKMTNRKRKVKIVLDC